MVSPRGGLLPAGVGNREQKSTGGRGGSCEKGDLTGSLQDETDGSVGMRTKEREREEGQKTLKKRKRERQRLPFQPAPAGVYSGTSQPAPRNRQAPCPLPPGVPQPRNQPVVHLPPHATRVSPVKVTAASQKEQVSRLRGML